MTDLFLNGKRAVVTGGTRGIGRAIVKRLLESGAAVTLCGRSEKSVTQAISEAAHPKLFGTIADVSNEAEVSALFQFADEHLGGVDILVNNAGIGLFQPVGEMSIEDWKRTIDVNLTGTFLCSRQAVQRMCNAAGGFIVNISSLAAKNAFRGGAAYNASKFGLTGLSEAMMLDHRYDGIRVSSILPGSVDTEFSPRNSGQPSDWKIAPADVAEMVIAVLRIPERTCVSSVEIRPSRPAR